MNINAYFQRIGFQDQPNVDLATLKRLHHQHLLHIPYENIDVQLRRPLDFDPPRIFDKLVNQRRGGWCYEMNGLLGAVYEHIGFTVTRLSGGVMRATQGDDAMANHLLLKVDLGGQAYLADVGLGDGLREPIPLEAGSYQQGGLTYALEQLDDGYWRFHNQSLSNVSSFDFLDTPADPQTLANKCAWLQSAAESPFRMLLIVQRFADDRIHLQLGKLAIEAVPNTSPLSSNESTNDKDKARKSWVLNDLEALQERLANVFGLHEDLSSIWPNICEAHERHFANSK